MLSRLFVFILSGLAVVVATAAEITPTFLVASSAALNNPHDLKLSPDGKYFFFTSGRGGSDDIYWVDAAIIETYRYQDRE